MLGGWMMLAPRFELGSGARKALMIGRTTPCERGVLLCNSYTPLNLSMFELRWPRAVGS